MSKQLKKRTMIFCEICNYKQIIEPESNPDLAEIASTKLQKTLPQYDATKGKTIQPEWLERPKMYKCPCCGRGVRVKDLLVPFVKALKEIDDAKEKARQEADRQKRIDDGKPIPKKDADPNFLG